jgi:iron complex outermembrane receptor protein
MNKLKKSLLFSCLFILYNTNLYGTITYTIQTKSLDIAIQQVSKLSKIPFIVDTTILQNKHANPIKNIKTLKKALKLILKGTDLKAIISKDTIVIKEITNSTKVIREKALADVLVIGNQDSYYDEYSSTSMKGEYRDIETPYSTTVTNETLINDIQALRMTNTYDYTTGVTAFSTKASGIIVRGFELDQENLNVGGMPGVTSRFNSPSTSNIEKIEIFKGPASVLYGNLESGAYINIQTKKPEGQDKVTLESSYKTYASDISGVGSDNSEIISLDATGSITDNIYYRIITVGEKIESFRNDVENENFYVFPSLVWNINDQSTLLFAAEYSKEEADADEGLVAIDNDINKIASIDTVYQEDGDFDNDKGKAFDVKFEHNLVDDSLLKVAWRSVFHVDERILYEHLSVNDTNETLIRRHRNQYNERVWHTLDTNYSFKINTQDIVHNIVTGTTIAYRKTMFEQREFKGQVAPINIYTPIFGETEKGPEGTTRKTTYTSKAVYIQDKADITDNLILVGAIRRDNTEIDFNCLKDSNNTCVKNNVSNFITTSGSAGAVYSVTDNTSVYLSYSQSKFPNSVEKFDKNDKVLEPEKSEQFEVGVKMNINEKFSTTLSFYKINKENILEQNANGDYEIVGEVESKGFEIDAQWLPTQNWQIKSGYAYNNSKNISGSNEFSLVKGSPQNTAFIFSRYNYPSKIFNGLIGLSAGVSYKDSIYTNSNTEKAVLLPSYKKLDLGFYYERKNWELSLSIQNLTNNKHFVYGGEDDGIFAGDPRNITISYKITL